MRFLLVALLIVALAASGRPFKTAAEASPQSPAPTPDHLVYDDWDDCTATETDKFCRRLGFILPWEQPPTPEQRKSRPQRVTVSTRGPTFYGETTMEHRIADADLIIIGRLATVSNTVEEYDFEGRTGHTGALRFTFSVDEVLKSPSGFTAPERLTALVGSIHELTTRAEALTESQSLLTERDTQWDGHAALIFLTSYTLTFPATKADDLYFISIIGRPSSFGDHYSIASSRNKVWLPEATASPPTAPQGGGETERFFLTDVPASEGATAQTRSTDSDSSDSNTVQTPNVALSNFKAEIARVSAEQGTDTSIRHRFCITRKNMRERMKAFRASRGERYYAPSPSSAEVEVASGLPASAVVYKSQKAVYGDDWESMLEYSGEDAALFVNGDLEVTYPSHKYSLGFSSRAVLARIDRHAGLVPLLTTRPLPKGVYRLTKTSAQAESLSCETYTYVLPINVTVTAPPGTLHEAFFDPVTLRQAQGRLPEVGADSSKGMLKPAAFTDANGASATIQRIEWASDTVKIKVNPHTGLSGHKLDFIVLDGSVSLSLLVDDATVDAANNTLSWNVAEQPWEDGDKLMIRIAEVVPEVALADVPPTVTQGSSESFTVKASGLSSADAYSIRLATNNYALGFGTGCGTVAKTVSVPSGSTSHSATIALHGCNVTTSTVTATLLQGTSTVDTATAEVEVEASSSVTEYQVIYKLDSDSSYRSTIVSRSEYTIMTDALCKRYNIQVRGRINSSTSWSNWSTISPASPCVPYIGHQRDHKVKYQTGNMPASYTPDVNDAPNPSKLIPDTITATVTYWTGKIDGRGINVSTCSVCSDTYTAQVNHRAGTRGSVFTEAGKEPYSNFDCGSAVACFKYKPRGKPTPLGRHIRELEIVIEEPAYYGVTRVYWTNKRKLAGSAPIDSATGIARTNERMYWIDSTMRHEFGHALGLGDLKGDPIFDTVDALMNDAQDVKSVDLDYLQAIYEDHTKNHN